ncbi:enolase [Angomonas deanei]|uniref:Phosphopyruvate hydratase n=1 Tax=Angomonas deanei TaxID=59799 RepID=A0A7G2CAN4_9TRYP|nr:enolase [Angomonas deanei]CAD2215964.1 hypothetical protein, conserved [Angomonas deanei]|eukprot:EPY35303.1 enolase [Angomonas deanei]
MDIALYEHVRRLSRQSDSGTRKEEERFALPRVLIPLMGSHGAEIPSGLLLETVYLIPTPPDTEGGKGALTAETWQRLHALVRYCSQQCDSRMRPDGSLLMPHMDNLTDVLELIKAAAEKVGMTLGEDVRVGIRFNCAAQSVQLSQTTAPAKGKKAAAKEVPSAENVEPTWVYTLFAGEAEVTGAQLSEYVIQQLTSFPNHGVIFLEDSHDTTDTEGWYRLHNAFKTMAVLSCRGAFSRHRGSAASLESLLAQVSASHIAANIALDPIQITDVSHFLSLAGASQKQNLWMSVYRGAEEGGAQEHLVDLAVGTGSSFVDIGPLLSASALVSRQLCVQERLSAQRQMEEQVSYVGRNSEEDFPVSAAEVPEIKRKNEKEEKK